MSAALATLTVASIVSRRRTIITKLRNDRYRPAIIVSKRILAPLAFLSPRRSWHEQLFQFLFLSIYIYIYLLLLLGWTVSSCQFAWWFSPWLVAVLGKTTRPTITGICSYGGGILNIFANTRGNLAVFDLLPGNNSGVRLTFRDWLSFNWSFRETFEIVKRIFMSFLRAIDEKIRLFCQVFAANTLSKRRKSLSFTYEIAVKQWGFFFILNRDLSLNYKYGDKSRCLVNFIKKKFFFDLKIRMIVRPGYLIIQTVPRLYDILCLSAE